MWTDEQRKAHKPRGGRYPSDISDEEWAIIEPMIPPGRTGGRKRDTDMREYLFRAETRGRAFRASGQIGNRETH